jgi:hypothetical protein
VGGPATAGLRATLRRDRIGAGPEREARPPETPGVAVTVGEEGGDRCWCCGSCGEALAPLDRDWRDAVPRREQPIVEAFGALGMQVRERHAEPRIAILTFFCPACAAGLAADVVTDRRGAASPELAAATAV